ncbi:sulfite exporter TauE/SafE family protein [Methanobacterium spitsbergense]|uniref:Probable membrane transporter protein n=1 Tax=Methanobacterium spitsbergense TaxID=2874285 RepID=A0A8T5UVJ8_9EURY|nr:sulfite exporter TauE/SafE family protein [Methanobacterium spitsbergense]MBZ2165946.1 sulfite exporter TauE/SafE family protein [Methanobacterium spitsbergense]
MDFLLYIVALLFTGVLVGFTSGLLGVGGGFIMVPVQFFLLTSLGIDPTTAIRVAFGTSLAVILPTAISGTIGHKRRGAVLTEPTVFMGISGIIAAFIGGTLASNIPGEYLKIIFGVLVLVAATWMLVAKYPEHGSEPKKGILKYLIIGFIAGILSGLLGIGGGVILVPILSILMGFSMHRAVGTSTAVLIFTSLGGIIAYTLNGVNISGLPPYSIGYVNLIQLITLSIITVPMAQLGVNASHKIPERELRYLYIAVMFYIGLKMMGIFSWVGIPL